MLEIVRKKPDEAPPSAIVCNDECMPEDMVTLKINKASAIVLFEELDDFHEEESIRVREPAFRIALWNVISTLQKELIEIFAPDYKQLLDEARKELIRSENSLIGN
jgi:hypothetical protein